VTASPKVVGLRIMFLIWQKTVKNMVHVFIIQNATEQRQVW